ncbi:MAG: sortase [Patescibacteria group bacterium]|nr:sortase [Patescibacteria group bacterium]
MIKISKHFFIILVLILSTYLLINTPTIINQTDLNFKKQKKIKQATKILNHKSYNNNTLIIPNLGISAPIKFIKKPARNATHSVAGGQNEEIILENLKKGIVHFPLTSKPNKIGNSVYIGHSSNSLWNRGDYDSVFLNLNQIKKDNLIFIAYNNKLYKYKTFQKFYISPSDLSIFNQTNNKIITLLTCWPPNTTFSRLAVQAKQIKYK